MNKTFQKTVSFLIFTTLGCQTKFVLPTKESQPTENPKLSESQVILKNKGQLVPLTQIQKDRLAEESVNYIIQCNFNSDKSEFVSKKDIEPEGAWQKSYNEKDFPKSLLAIYFKDTVSVQSISGPVKMTEIFF